MISNLKNLSFIALFQNLINIILFVGPIAPTLFYF